ncbi:MAG TPA: hypothetical protein VMH86_11810 [Rhizomicrobium sp.]|nr:hypothetical protein [Rhizomicrobium sp.]
MIVAGTPAPAELAVTDWLQLILLAGLAGAVGQCTRIIVGIKKVNDQASATNQSLGDLVDLSRMVVSLLIGFTAGVLASLVMPNVNIHAMTAEMILAFAAAGYTGSDFIEGIMSRYVPATQASNGNSSGSTSSSGKPTPPLNAKG